MKTLMMAFTLSLLGISGAEACGESADNDYKDFTVAMSAPSEGNVEGASSTQLKTKEMDVNLKLPEVKVPDSH